MSKSNSKSKILFIMTGSIACYKACHVLSQLIQNNFDVQVVTTRSALEFVGNSTIEGLTKKPIISDTHQVGHAMNHIDLVRWADLIIAAPASGNYINKIAHGISDDLATTMFLSHDFKKPFLLAPATNTSMYQHPITQESLGKLKELGVSILETSSGVLACGEVGWGRLLEPDMIYQKIVTALNLKKTETILVTSGGTQEPIDEVRSITNFSSGKTGGKITDQLILDGFEVIYLHSVTAKLPRFSCKQISFTDFKSLSFEMKNILESRDIKAVVHAAAVSDFSVSKVSTSAVLLQGRGKISSENEEVYLTLKRNPKIIDQIREWSKNKNLKLIAFKMTTHADEKTVNTSINKLMNSSRADLIVHNDLDEISSQNHQFNIYSSDLKKLTTLNNSSMLGEYLSHWIFSEKETL